MAHELLGCRGGDNSETNGLIANSDAADTDGRPEPSPTRGRYIASAVTLAATAACAAIGMHFGQQPRTFQGGRLQAVALSRGAASGEVDDEARSLKLEERSLLIGDNVFDTVAQEVYGHKLEGLWQVPRDVFPQTLANPSHHAREMDPLEQCQVISGTAQNFSSDGSQWLKLDQDASDRERWVSLDKFELQKISYVMLSAPGDLCESRGLFPIVAMPSCKMAAAAMGITPTVLSTTLESMPEGCFVFNHSTALLNVNRRSKGNGATEITRIMCSTLKECVPFISSTTTVTSTTTSDTVSTSFTHTKRFDGVSLFCFVLAEADGYEADLLRFARSRDTGAYGCEEHMTLTDDSIDVGTDKDPEPTVAIGSLKCDKGEWGSWANAKIFLKAWKAVMDDGRFRKHDWVIKLDADTVFYPDRLKKHVEGMKSTDLLFLQNYLDGYPVVGAIEVASNAAILAFGQRIDECERITYGAEDDWFVKCMRVLGAWMQKDEELLQHNQHPRGNMCRNKRFVAMHPYKSQEEYGRCLDSAEGDQAYDAPFDHTLNDAWNKLGPELNGLHATG